MADKITDAVEGQELAWAAGVTESIDDLTTTCQNLTEICRLLKLRVEKLEANAMTNPKLESE